MTKVVKWWQRITFWNKFKACSVAFGGIFGTGIWLAHGSTTLQVIVGCVSFAGVVVGIVFEDKNNNGIADAFENQIPNERKKKS